MAQTVLLPGFGSLSPEEKKLVEEWIKSILLAKKASANLLKLVSHNQASPDFMARLEEVLNQSDDFEIVESDTTPKLATVNEMNPIILTSCEAICKGDPECLKNCKGVNNKS